MSDLPPLVRVFMADHIRTLAELQLLITCMDSDERWWDAPAAAPELGIPSLDARRALDHLASRNLLDIRITGDVRYQFRPGTDEPAGRRADSLRHIPRQSGRGHQPGGRHVPLQHPRLRP